MRPHVKNFSIPIAMLTLALAGTAWAVDLAHVNGKVITDKDLELALGGLNEGQRSGVLKDANSRRQVLTSVIDQQLLVEEAQKEKLDQDQDYKDALEGFKRQFLSNRILSKNLSGQLTDKTAKKYYESHKSRYSTDQVHALHILVNDEETAREVLKKAKAADNDDAFKEMAEKMSKDPSAKNNRGDLGFIGRDRLVPEFTEPAFAAAEGELVGPVKTSYGYHVIRVVKKKVGKPLQFDEVELRVKNDLRNELIQNYLSNLKKQAKVNVDEKALDKI